MVKKMMNKTASDDSPIVKCSHCKQMYASEEFAAHECNLPLTDVKQIPVVYFQDDSVNGKKIMTGKGVDGILYSFIVTPRMAIPYFMSNRRKVTDPSWKDKTDGEVPEPCHHVKHIGLAGILANEGKIDYDKLVEHFCKVNSCSKEDFELHVKDAFRIWKKRSLYPWKQDFGKYGLYVKEKTLPLK
jgi:hypothetical protein